MNPLTPILDQLTKQAVMHFRPEDVSRVHRVCQEVVRGHRVTVDLPLPAWDSLAMGVAFRRVDKQNVKGAMRKFKRTASFVLEGKELEQEGQIRAKASIALGCILQTVLCQIREVKPTAVAPVVPTKTSEDMGLYEERKLADDVARMEKDEEDRYRD